MTDQGQTPHVDETTRPRRSSGAHYRELDDHVVILDLDSSVYSTLNPVGSLIWNEADGNLTVAQLVDIVVEVFDVSHETATDDTIQFVEAMAAEGLFEV